MRVAMTNSPSPASPSAKLLGVEIGGTKLQIVQGDAAGTISRRWRATVDRRRGGPGILEQLCIGIDELTRGGAARPPRRRRNRLWRPVDRSTGRVRVSHQIEGWDDFPLRDWVSEAAGTPAVLENDANTAALGEALRGAGRGFDPVFYVTLGSGVGGGLVAGGAIYHGASPGEAEFGHVRLDRDGATVESRCSGWAVDARVRRLATEEPASFLARSLPATPGGEARLLAPALNAGDPASGRVIREIAADLAFALSHAVHLFHPRVIVLGGGLSLIGESLRTAVAAHLPLHVMEAFAPGPEVRLAALGEDAVPAGALCLAGRAAGSLL
jgi:glucokinase